MKGERLAGTVHHHYRMGWEGRSPGGCGRLSARGFQRNAAQSGVSTSGFTIEITDRLLPVKVKEVRAERFSPALAQPVML